MGVVEMWARFSWLRWGVDGAFLLTPGTALLGIFGLGFVKNPCSNNLDAGEGVEEG